MRSKKVSKNCNGLLDQAYVFFRRKKFKEALTIFQEIKEDNSNEKFEKDLGIVRCKLNLGDVTEGLNSLNSLNNKKLTFRQNRLINTTLAAHYIHQGDIDSAKQALKAIKDQQHYDVRREKVHLLILENKLEEAIAECQKIEKEHSSKPTIFLIHAIVLDELGAIKDAIDVLQSCQLLTKKSLKPKSLEYLAKVYALCSILYRELGNFTDAFKYAKLAIQHDNEYALAWTAMGKCYQLSATEGDLKKAGYYFDKSMKLNPEGFNYKHGKTVTTQSKILFLSPEETKKEGNGLADGDSFIFDRLMTMITREKRNPADEKDEVVEAKPSRPKVQQGTVEDVMSALRAARDANNYKAQPKKPVEIVVVVPEEKKPEVNEEAELQKFLKRQAKIAADLFKKQKEKEKNSKQQKAVAAKRKQPSSPPKVVAVESNSLIRVRDALVVCAVNSIKSFSLFCKKKSGTTSDPSLLPKKTI